MVMWALEEGETLSLTLGESATQKFLLSLSDTYFSQGDLQSSFLLSAVTAFRGNAEGQFNLGKMFSDGEGVEKDDAEAAKWYTEAAKQGFSDAQNNLGVMYLHGEGVVQSHSEAIKWFSAACDQGNARAAYNLGVKFWYGDGLRRNVSQALKLFSQAVQDPEFGPEAVKLLREGLTDPDVKLTQLQKAKVDFFMASLGISEASADSAAPSSAPSGPEPAP